MPAAGAPRPPWYRAGLRFACTGCGRCCSGAPGYTFVTRAEIEALARRLGLDLDAFGRRHLRRVGSRYALLEDPRTGACTFLRGRSCTVYETRPRPCRAYPFWPGLLASPAHWRAAARDCEGIRDAAPLVPLAEIRVRQDGA